MPAECSFPLNSQRISILTCAGFGAVTAFSGNGRYINDPGSTNIENDGPLPRGVYYIVDRESGGRMGWLNDFRADLLAGTHRSDWFALYRNDGVIDDWTSIDGIRRGQFRLHPVGYWGISDGCITLPLKKDFEALRHFLKAQRTAIVPGTTLKYYGRVVVK